MAYQYTMNNFDTYDLSLSFEENFIRGGVISLEKLMNQEEGIHYNSMELKVSDIEYVDTIQESDIYIQVDDVNGTRTIYFKLVTPEAGPAGPKGDIGFTEVISSGINYSNLIPATNTFYQIGTIPSNGILSIQSIPTPVDISVTNVIAFTFMTSGNANPVNINTNLINGYYSNTIFLPNTYYGVLLTYNNLTSKWDMLSNRELLIVPGPKGNQGLTGVSYKPSVDEEGNITWTNDGNLPNPESVNIRGPKGLDAYYYGTEEPDPDVGLWIDPSEEYNTPSIRYGTADPDNSIGVNGDIYIKIID